jgi:uncharacterized Zn-binding protein involved in type VI secretion
MPKASFKSAVGTGHGCHYPPTNATEGSPNVFINGKRALRVGDHFAAHGCPVCGKPVHGRALADGSPEVYIDGRRAGRIGDPIDCGGRIVTGSDNVFINGE